MWVPEKKMSQPNILTRSIYTTRTSHKVKMNYREENIEYDTTRHDALDPYIETN